MILFILNTFNFTVYMFNFISLFFIPHSIFFCFQFYNFQSNSIIFNIMDLKLKKNYSGLQLINKYFMISYFN